MLKSCMILRCPGLLGMAISNLVITLFIVFLASETLRVSGQDVDDDDYYTIKGRVVDSVGKPINNASVGIAPVVFDSHYFDTTGLQRFVKTGNGGLFCVREYRNEFTIGRSYYLFVSVDNNVEARRILKPPFGGVREYDRSFDGKLVQLGAVSVIDVGDVSVQFWYGQANLDFIPYKKAEKLGAINWNGLYLQIRNEFGDLVYLGSLSQDDIDEKTKYLSKSRSELRISLPEGRWKAEAVWDDMVLAESAYFQIKRDEKPVAVKMNFKK